LALRYSQQEFAQYLGASTKSVRNWETSKNGQLPVYQRALDTVLERLSPDERARFEQLQGESQAGPPERDVSYASHGPAAQWQLALPEGRTLGTPVLAMQKYEVRTRDEEYVRVRLNRGDNSQVLPQPLHGLVAGEDTSSGEPRLFAVDALQVRRKASSREEVRIPRAYELDDFALAVLWATAGFDSGLLNDDALLARARSDLHSYENLTRSAVSREVVAELHPVSQAWLGSGFCARHIVRNLPRLEQRPEFWTAERTGEDAATWLFFRHKHDYLRKLQDVYGKATCLTRSFCILERHVAASSTGERVLMFLALALMEAMGVIVRITADDEFLSVGGFVLAPKSRALVANWVAAEGLWHVDSTTQRDVLLDFQEATGHAAGHSVTSSGTSTGRLQQAADYLGLDWTWLVRRCSEISKYGAAGLLMPRSRLLSPAGLETACEYAGASGTAPVTA